MKIIINQNEYDYSDAYLEEFFKNEIKENTLDLSNLPDLDKYNSVKKVFDYICNMTTGLSGEPFPTKELEEENAKIRSAMNKVDNLQKYLKEKGNEKESINNMERFIEVMLKHNEEYLKHGDEFVEEDEYGII